MEQKVANVIAGIALLCSAFAFYEGKTNNAAVLTQKVHSLEKAVEENKPFFKQIRDNEVQIRMIVKEIDKRGEVITRYSELMEELGRKTLTSQNAVARNEDSLREVSNVVARLEKQGAVSSEVLDRLNNTLSKLDTTMDNINNTVVRLDERVKNLELRGG